MAVLELVETFTRPVVVNMPSMSGGKKYELKGLFRYFDTNQLKKITKECQKLAEENAKNVDEDSDETPEDFSQIYVGRILVKLGPLEDATTGKAFTDEETLNIVKKNGCFLLAVLDAYNAANMNAPAGNFKR